jgi:hypothetical protein
MDIVREIVLHPLVGINIDGIEINFGAKLEEVENLLGEPVDEIYENENINISFNFNDHDILEYIECGSNCLMTCKVSIYKNNLFEIPIRDLYDILSEHCENIHEKTTAFYFFEDIGVDFRIGYIGENPDWSEEEMENKDEYEFYAVTSIGIGTKNAMESLMK